MFRERFVSTFAIALAVGSLTAGTAWAQDRTSNGNTTGSSAPRGGDGGSSSSSSGGSSGSSSSGSSGSSGGSWDSSSGGSRAATWNSSDAPRRSGDQSGGRSAGDNPSTGRAAPRGGDSGSRGGGSTASTSGDRSSGSSADAPSRAAVPAYSRPRDGRPVTGVAVDRGTVRPPAGGGSIIYYPYYSPYGFWGPSYGYGLGYLFYDPWYGSGWGYGDPYGYGYGGYGGSGGYAVSQSYRDTGSLRLKIDPKQAQVYIDGYYVGTVDDFDGVFQKLSLDSGDHRVELKAEGYEPTTFEVLITPGETVTYKGDMKRK